VGTICQKQLLEIIRELCYVIDQMSLVNKERLNALEPYLSTQESIRLSQSGGIRAKSCSLRSIGKNSIQMESWLDIDNS